MAQPSSSRNGKRVRLIGVHTAEGARKVEDLDAYFRRTQAGSSHAGVDDTRLVEGWVPYDCAAWTLRSGNPVSDNIELCAFASWSRAEWLKHDRMLTLTAQWIASRCKTRGIPCVLLSESDVAAGESGVIGHVTWTRAMKDGTHWDPGPNFPWDVVMSRARAALGGSSIPTSISSGGFLMALNDQQQGEIYSSLLNSTGDGRTNIQYILDQLKKVDGIADDVASMKSDVAAVKKDVGDLQDVVWRGGPGTPHDQTVAQKVDQNAKGQAR